MCRKLIIAGTALAIAAGCCPCAFARKMKLSVKPEVADTIAMTEGSLTVCSPCVPCNDGYSIDQAQITGFDKRAEALVESFFITNTTDRRLTGLDFTLSYYTLDGRMLHSRHVEIDCDIPAGQTRKFDIKSFDRQKSFYYHKSQAPSRRRATPFRVELQIGCLHLR